MKTTTRFSPAFLLLLAGLLGLSTAGTAQAQTTCAAPTNVYMSTRFGADTVTFTPVSGATNYFVSLAINNTIIQTVTVPAPPVRVTPLPPNTGFTVCVEAICPSGRSPSSCTSFRPAALATGPGTLAAGISLAPNPARGTATLTLPAGLLRQAVAVTLSNALGQVVRTYPPINTPVPAALDLTGLAAGVYQVRLLTAEGAVSKRLLVE